MEKFRKYKALRASGASRVGALQLPVDLGAPFGPRANG